MKKNVVKILLILFIMCGFTAQGLAEPPGYLDEPPTKQQRDRVRKRIETLKMWKLTKALDIDETTSAKLFPLLNRYDKRKAEIHQNIRKGMREMRSSLKENRTEGLKNTLAMLEENHKALQSINDEEWAEMKKVLTVEQQAKFILFKQEFDRDVRKVISDAKGRRHKRVQKNRYER
jgi:Spy/CpxP family protein refolding chaperone